MASAAFAEAGRASTESSLSQTPASKAMLAHIDDLQTLVEEVQHEVLDVVTVIEDGRVTVTEGTLEGLVNRLASVTETEVDYVHEVCL